MKKLSKQQLELLKLLKKVWEKYPELRFGQLIYNFILEKVCDSERELIIQDPFERRDEEIIKDLKDKL